MYLFVTKVDGNMTLLKLAKIEGGGYFNTNMYNVIWGGGGFQN